MGRPWRQRGGRRANQRPDERAAEAHLRGKAEASAGKMGERGKGDSGDQMEEQPQHTVEDVAREVGYSDASVLYRAFTRGIGMSPREYQERFGG